jgi:hypothetical protein
MGVSTSNRGVSISASSVAGFNGGCGDFYAVLRWLITSIYGSFFCAMPQSRSRQGSILLPAVWLTFV